VFTGQQLQSAGKEIAVIIHRCIIYSYEKFLEYFGTAFLRFLVRHKITGTFKYVNDKLLNYNGKLIDTNLILQEFNTTNQTYDLPCTLLNITIQKTESSLAYNITKCMDFHYTTYW
jgi:hypothetical protein